eukprot:TRINITY_DN339_c0_g2_i3.p1 TRINITY_DN339_c0_g2~~TRINITY_DN339_c0_g2_i3.p1  ORF type:complete len:1103 (-),score=108.71 TRINITY_DN339_c0_g2_i3:2962-6270(-)
MIPSLRGLSQMRVRVRVNSSSSDAQKNRSLTTTTASLEEGQTATVGRKNAMIRWWESLPVEFFLLVGFYLSGPEIARLCCVNRSSCELLKDHPSWQELVLKEFGFKYENYAMYSETNEWRLLYARITLFLGNMQAGTPVQTVFPNLLQRLACRDYEGAVAMSPDAKLLLWENGQCLQVVDVNCGKSIFMIPISVEEYPRNRDTRPCIVNTRTKVFVHLNGEILVFSLENGTRIGKLVAPGRDILQSNDFALDISVRNEQVAFLALDAVYVWNSSSLRFLYKIKHWENQIRGDEESISSSPLQSNFDSSEDLDFLWAGYQRKEENGDDGESSVQKNNTKDRRSSNIVTWVKRRGFQVCVFNIDDGKRICNLKGHSREVLRVRQTPSPFDSNEYFLATLDISGEVRLWDSSRAEFCSSFYVLQTGSNLSFRLCFTSSHLVLLSENTETGGLHDLVELKIWDFHPPKPSREWQRVSRGGPSPQGGVGSSRNNSAKREFLTTPNVVVAASRSFFTDPVNSCANDENRRCSDGEIVYGASSPPQQRLRSASDMRPAFFRRDDDDMAEDDTLLSLSRRSTSHTERGRDSSFSSKQSGVNANIIEAASPTLPPLHPKMKSMSNKSSNSLMWRSNSLDIGIDFGGKISSTTGTLPTKLHLGGRTKKAKGASFAPLLVDSACSPLPSPVSRNYDEDQSTTAAVSLSEPQQPILTGLRSTVLRSDVYFADFIDNRLLGMWYSTRGAPSEEPWALASSDWEVYELFDDYSTEEEDPSWRKQRCISSTTNSSNKENYMHTPNASEAFPTREFRKMNILDDSTTTAGASSAAAAGRDDMVDKRRSCQTATHCTRNNSFSTSSSASSSQGTPTANCSYYLSTTTDAAATTASTPVSPSSSFLQQGQSFNNNHSTHNQPRPLRSSHRPIPLSGSHFRMSQSKPPPPSIASPEETSPYAYSSPPTSGRHQQQVERTRGLRLGGEDPTLGLVPSSAIGRVTDDSSRSIPSTTTSAIKHNNIPNGLSSVALHCNVSTQTGISSPAPVAASMSTSPQPSKPSVCLGAHLDLESRQVVTPLLVVASSHSSQLKEVYREVYRSERKPSNHMPIWNAQVIILIT